MIARVSRARMDARHPLDPSKHFLRIINKGGIRKIKVPR